MWLPLHSVLVPIHLFGNTMNMIWQFKFCTSRNHHNITKPSSYSVSVLCMGMSPLMCSRALYTERSYFFSEITKFSFLTCLQLQGMEDELRGAPTSHRNAMSTKLRLYRRDLGKLQRDMKNTAPGFGSSFQPVEGSHHGIYASQNQQSVSVGLGTAVWTWCHLIMRVINRTKTPYMPVWLLAILILYEHLKMQL